MKCPHCLVEFHDNTTRIDLPDDAEGKWYIERNSCPSCGRSIYHLIKFELVSFGGILNPIEHPISTIMLYPKATNRSPVPKEVPKEFAKDYIEACLVLSDSPMASAALSRRCLQNILRDKLKVKNKNLEREIQEVIDRSLLPSDLIESIDSIRNIGNFAAHPIKSNSSGEIVDVEIGEAEWNLDVIEMLFDYLFVRPELIKKKKDALNAKLSDAGKPIMK